MKIGSTYGTVNLLWSFDVVTEEWEVLSGETTHYGSAVYGTIGVPDALNTPLPDYTPSCWTTESLAFYVGFGSSFTNALWKYEPEASAIGDPHIT